MIYVHVCFAGRWKIANHVAQLNDRVNRIGRKEHLDLFLQCARHRRAFSSRSDTEKGVSRGRGEGALRLTALFSRF